MYRQFRFAKRRPMRIALWTLLFACVSNTIAYAGKLDGLISIDTAPIASDKSVKYDYPIVYVRSPRWVEDRGQKRPARWAEFAHAFNVNPGSDLVLLHPNGKEEVLVEAGQGAVQDPYVSFDGETVFYTLFHKAGNGPNAEGADIYKIHVPTRKITRLTDQTFVAAKRGEPQRYGVYNMHPCPVPGDRVAFVSSRNGYLPPPKSYPAIAMQLHTMDDDGANLETIGHLNLAGALHPVILKDGRLLFSSLENMGLRNYILWGIWSIHPDGTNWAPVVSALHGHSSPSAWHFQTQLSDEDIVVELYYNQNQKGFGSLFKLPPKAQPEASAFGPGDATDERNPGWDMLGSNGMSFRFPFTPQGMESITPWIRTNDFPAWPSDPKDEKSPRIGKVTHPCAAPDNHLLVAWTLGPIGGSAGAVREHMGPQPIDSGIYLIKHGDKTDGPGEMLLIKNDPNYNEQWPRPLVSYQRVYGVKEPKTLTHQTKPQHVERLPEATPFGLIGTSSFYKRESAPMGRVEPGSVTSVFPSDYKGRSWQHTDSEFMGTIWNWRGQGADAGRYSNEEIHAVRIVAFEPNTHTRAAGNKYGYPAYSNHAGERLRILGEIPLRKFIDGKQPLDPDGQPDTSFLARIPADTAFTFQTIDRHGMVLNMAQTWHQVRPGEARYDCGGCHAHSQQPTLFEETYAATDDYQLFDLTEHTPLLTAQSNDDSVTRWDIDNAAGLRYQKGPHDVEYFRDIQPIFAKSCVACHSIENDKAPAGLVLDDESSIQGMPGTYFRLAGDERAKFSPRRLEPRKEEFVVRGLLHHNNASHYIWKFQSRRSLLVWKLFGRRLDGWTNDHIASEFVSPTDPRRKSLHTPGGDEPTAADRLFLGDTDYQGQIMPPPEAVAAGKVSPLSDEDKRTIIRWIDLGCPIDLSHGVEAKEGQPLASGYLSDDQRPTLTLARPTRAPADPPQSILLGMFDYNAGLDLDSFEVVADFTVGNTPAGENLASQFKPLPDHRWELPLKAPIREGVINVTIQDKQGNQSQVKRRFRVR